jgi:hypothetical protein
MNMAKKRILLAIFINVGTGNWVSVVCIVNRLKAAKSHKPELIRIIFLFRV